mgnify:CR=1 FL=1
MIEYKHNPVLKGVNGVNVLLVLGLDLQEGIHEAHPLQVLSEGSVFMVPPEPLQNILYLFALLALPHRQLAEPQTRLIDSHLSLAQLLHWIDRRSHWLRQELFI